jgi:alpha-L-fucosidase
MFDADKFVAQAKEAGMKYIVMVAKHHDGFCMWDSEFTDFDMMSTPFKRDILGEMAAAAHKAGLKFGIYYSQRDWHHPDYKQGSMDKYNAYMRNQLKELLSKYGEMSVLFFDSGEWKTSDFWEGDQLFKMAYQLQPNIVINDRCGVPGDYSTPEQSIGNFDNKRDWESCMTFTGFWSWHGFQTPVIPLEACVKYLISCAGGDGNLLMNIGPMPTGQIDPREASRLKEIGQWLKKYGESIYGTRGGPFLPDSTFASTYKENQIFVHIFSRKDNEIELPAIKESIVKAEILSGSEIRFNQTKNSISLLLPDECKQNIVTVVKLTLNKAVNEAQIPVKME